MAKKSAAAAAADEPIGFQKGDVVRYLGSLCSVTAAHEDGTLDVQEEEGAKRWFQHVAQAEVQPWVAEKKETEH